MSFIFFLIKVLFLWISKGYITYWKMELPLRILITSSQSLRTSIKYIKKKHYHVFFEIAKRVPRLAIFKHPISRSKLTGSHN